MCILDEAKRGRHRLLLTSRPYAVQSEREAADLEVTNKGISEHQVQVYVKSSEPHIEERSRLLAFVGQHQQLQDVIRVPVNLKIL